VANPKLSPKRPRPLAIKRSLADDSGCIVINSCIGVVSTKQFGFAFWYVFGACLDRISNILFMCPFVQMARITTYAIVAGVTSIHPITEWAT